MIETETLMQASQIVVAKIRELGIDKDESMRMLNTVAFRTSVCEWAYGRITDDEFARRARIIQSWLR